MKYLLEQIDLISIFDENYFQSLNDDEMINIQGLFKGLEYIGIKKKLLLKIIKSHCLDEFLKAKYKNNINGYMNDYINNNYSYNSKIKSNIETSIENPVIYDDDHCSNCLEKGYYSKNNKIANFPPDCQFCLSKMCKNCYYDTKEDNLINKKMKFSENDSICKRCFNIMKKINSHQDYDKKKFDIKGDIDINYIIELIEKQKTRCYKCTDKVLTINYEPYCLFQFSIDRIDNFLPHNKDNVRISCYYCNCKHKFDNDEGKNCKLNCHKEKTKNKIEH